MKLKDKIIKYAVSSVILLLFFFTISGLKASATPGESTNSSALTHAVLAENASTTD
ncbi:MAG: hypothetical protein MUO78_04505 [candidate division Zixibacteria bacterium]|nr:hypothetical protein [candidate division Zixibacteria bacterium]